MDRTVEEYLQINKKYRIPYIIHDGRGTAIGCGTKDGCGTAYTFSNTYDTYSGSDIIEYKGNKTYLVNGYLIYIEVIRNQWAKGKIIKNDLTTQNCYLGKINNIIVVGESVRECLKMLQTNIMKKKNNMDDLAKAFVLSHPHYQKSYNWGEMVSWHMLSNISCEHGRKKFTQIFNKKDNDTATPKELIECMKKMRKYENTLACKMEELYLKQDKNDE